MSDIYIFGDIGGHYDPFMKALDKIGVDTDTGVIPEGVTVIQVGDLVHRGPDSEKLVEFVDEALSVKPEKGRGRWVQLLGNHEGHHIGGPKFGQRQQNGDFLDWELSKDSEKILKKWKHSRQAFMAASLTRTDKEEPRDMLVTHAGLCRQTWAAIDFPMTADEAAKRLNAQTTSLAFAPGWMLGGYMKSKTGGMQPPGVAWASPAKEVYPSWIEHDALFDQVHGHATLWNWWSEQWYADSDITLNIDRWAAKRFTRWTNRNGNIFYCIDQALGKNTPKFDVTPLHVVGHLTHPYDLKDRWG